MKNINTLVIIAAGLSSRMNGVPKHLCKINDVYNIVNTIEKSKYYFDEIFIVLNRKLSVDNKQLTEEILKEYKNVKLLYIESGRGDADAILKAINRIESLRHNNCVICWGDAYFKNSQPFKDMLSTNLDYCDSVLLAGVCLDKNPYAWFDVSKFMITKSHFKKYDGEIDYGIHDQSIFRINGNIFKIMLTTYANYLGYDGENYLNTDNNEMGLLNFITWVADTYKNTFNEYLAKPLNIQEKNVYSFNTIEELDNLNKLIRNESCSN